jgi:hypothetical protein
MTGRAESFRCGKKTAHVLKTAPEQWDATERGDKTAEFRRNDRGYQRGDHLMLVRGTDGAGPSIEVEVTDVLPGPAFGIPEGFAMLSHRPPIRRRVTSDVAPASATPPALLGLIAPNGMNDG